MATPPEVEPTGLVPVPELFIFLRRAIPDNTVVIHDKAFINNVAFALQYIDHLLGTLADDRLRTTIHSQTCKSIVLAGMGVVEAILWFVVVEADLANNTSWRETSRQKGVPSAQFGRQIRIDTIIFEEVSPPEREEMTLDTLMKKVEKKHLLGIADNKVYGTLKALRQLRNRIHIHDVAAGDDTDWYKFTGREVVMLLNSLNAIFETALFSPQPHHVELLSFLDPDRVERRR